MAITIRHDAAAVGTMPSNQNRRLGQQLVLQRQSQVFTDAQRDKDRLYDNFRQEAQNRFQLTRDARERLDDRERMQLGFENQRGLQQDRINAERGMLADRNKAEQQQWMDRREIERNDLQAQAGQARRDQEISSLKAGIAQADHTPEGKRKAGELLGNLKAIEAQRDTLRPEQYNGLIDKWQQEYNASGLDQYVKPVPKIDLEMKNRTHDYGTGNVLIMQPDGRMDVREIDPSKANPARANGASGVTSPVPQNMPFEHYMQDPQQNPKTAQSLYSQGKKYAEAKISQNTDGASPRAATDEEIKEGMKQAYAEQQQQSRIMSSFQPAPAPAQQPQAQQPPAQQQPQSQPPSQILPSNLLRIGQSPEARSQAAAAQPPSDYDAARSFLIDASSKYPNKQDMPPEVRAKVDQALSVIYAQPQSVAPQAQPKSNQPSSDTVSPPQASPSVDQLENTLNESSNMSPEQRIATLMPQVKLGIPQDNYTSLSQWMSDADMRDAFSVAVNAGQYKPEQYREYVLKQVDDMMTEGLTDRIISMKAKQKHQSVAAKVVPELQQTAPKVNTAEEASNLLENDFIAPDGTHRYKPR